MPSLLSPESDTEVDIDEEDDATGRFPMIDMVQELEHLNIIAPQQVVLVLAIGR